MEKGIRKVKVDRNEDNEVTHVRLVFGPHYFVELDAMPSGDVTFVLGATHHGFRADASGVSGELERIIEEIREAHPGNTVD